MEGQSLCQVDARDGFVPAALLGLTWVPGWSSVRATCLCGVGVGVERCSLMQSGNVKGQVLLAGSSD